MTLASRRSVIKPVAAGSRNTRSATRSVLVASHSGNAASTAQQKKPDPEKDAFEVGSLNGLATVRLSAVPADHSVHHK
jgi:hypothetical protein